MGPDKSFTSEFERAAGWLLQGLRQVHHCTNPEIPFGELVKSIHERLEEGDLPAEMVDQYTNGQLKRDKLGHFIETAVASTFRALQLHDIHHPFDWVYLCHAYFEAGMATVQMNAARGPNRRAEPYNAMKDSIMYLVEFRCPAEKWASLEEMWRGIEDGVIEANNLFEGMPGYSKDPKAAFDRLARKKRSAFLPFLSGPVKRGRPPKKHPRT